IHLRLSSGSGNFANNFLYFCPQGIREISSSTCSYVPQRKESTTMSKLTLAGFLLPLFLLFASPEASSSKAFGATKKAPEIQGQTGTLQKMIVENGSVTMDLDLNRLNGVSFAPQQAVTLQFTVAADSFFSILVFNDLLRGPEQGSMALIPAGVNAPGYNLPAALGVSLKELVVE